MYQELVINLHMHTSYSDGKGSHQEVAKAALKVGLDGIIITDHNILVRGMDQFFEENGKKLLMIVGEEIHDCTLHPPKNHVLAIGHEKELSHFAHNPQILINQIKSHNGLAILAHPHEIELPLFHEGDYSWVSWDVNGFHGLEIWNGLSELKTVIRNRLGAIFYAFFPEFIATSPCVNTLKKWDELNTRGQRIVAVCGSDAHNLKIRMGFLGKSIFPYEFHFRCLNNHLLTPTLLSGEVLKDKNMIVEAVKSGHSFIGYDLPSSTKGFRFIAQGDERNAIMGDTIALGDGVTLQVRNPGKCECVLIRNGKPLQRWLNREICTYLVNKPGVYRVECYINFLGKRRGWIFSNPIHIIEDDNQ